MGMSFMSQVVSSSRRKVVVILYLLCLLPGRNFYIRAHICEVGQENNVREISKWVLPYAKPCKCTGVRFGGMNTRTPIRPFKPVHANEPLHVVSNVYEVAEIEQHYGIRCTELVCPLNHQKITDPRKPTATEEWQNPFMAVNDINSKNTNVTCMPSSGSEFPIGKRKVVCMADDGTREPSTCIFYVTVYDEESPIVVCALNQTLESDPGQPTAVAVWDAPNATDNLGQNITLECDKDSGSRFEIGKTDVVCKAKDPSGNQATCKFTIDVKDMEAPILVCATNQMLESDPGQPTSVAVWYAPNASDNSRNNLTILCDRDPGSRFKIGETDVVCEALDMSGNRAKCNFTIDVKDKEAPILICTTNQPLKSDPGQPTALAVWDTPNATDNSGKNPTILCNKYSGSRLEIGETEVVCEALDMSGNLATCNFTIDVKDKEDPILICGSHQTLVMDPGQPTALVIWDAPNATDNSGQKPTILCNKEPGSRFEIGETDVVCEALDMSGNLATCNFTIDVKESPKDCRGIQANGHVVSGQYEIFPQDGGSSFPVYCDMDTDGGGWLVFQRRQDGSVNFYRYWDDYEIGFGNVTSEHWLGNEKISRTSAQGRYELRVDLADFEGNSTYAKYDNFLLGDASTNYMLVLGAYNGSAGDSLSYSKNQAFSTKDRDNSHDGDCALRFKGAWWYHKCHKSNLNGLYLGGPHKSFADGVDWKAWRGYKYSLKHTEMKMRPL